MSLLVKFTCILAFGTILSDATGEQEIKWLAGEVTKLWSELSSFIVICSTLGDGQCGPCRCRDSNELFKKFYCDCTNLTPQRDCRSFHETGMTVDGVYMVHQNNLKLIEVFCDQTTDGGGWTVFQRRANGTVRFYRDWYNYKVGFGDLKGHFWLGNENLHTLSLQSLPGRSELRIDLQDWSNAKFYAKYNDFQIGDEHTKYTLHVSGFSGSVKVNGMALHNGQRFSTYDDGNWCAKTCQAAWWYSTCYSASLNGRYYYYGETVDRYRGIHWKGFGDGERVSLKFTEMKLRRKSA